MAVVVVVIQRRVVVIQRVMVGGWGRVALALRERDPHVLAYSCCSDIRIFIVIKRPPTRSEAYLLMLLRISCFQYGEAALLLLFAIAIRTSLPTTCCSEIGAWFGFSDEVSAFQVQSG